MYHTLHISTDIKHKIKLPIRKNKIKNHEHSLQKNKVSNKPNPRQSQQKVQEAINKAFNDLKSLWYSKQISECHMEIMTKVFNRENNPTKVLDEIKKEYSEVDRDVSLVQKVMYSVVTRETCVQAILGLIQQYEHMQITQLRKQFQDKISHLRILTIHCIQCIFQWQQTLKSMGYKLHRIKYLYKGEPYTKKIKQDYQMIINSCMKNIYRFDDKKIDAFFLNYSIQGRKMSNISKNLIKRVRVCETMLNEDAEGVADVKRSPLIDKIGSPSRNADFSKEKSLTHKIKTSGSSTTWTKVPVQYSNFQQYIINMLSKSQYQHSFLPTVDMAKYQQYTILRFSQTLQQSILAIDRNASQRKIIILAINSSSSKIQNFLKILCEHLWKNDHCSEIRVPLLHIKDKQSYRVDQQLEKRIKNVGFKWTSVNHSNQTRTTIYGMKRPMNIIAEQNNKKVQMYPVIIQHLVAFKLSEGEIKKNMSNKCYASALDLLNKVQECDEKGYKEICQREEFSNYLESIKKIRIFLEKEGESETKFQYDGMKSFNIDTQQAINKLFVNLELPSKTLTPPTIISLLNTSFKYRHTTIQDGKFTKFFPNKDSEILICESSYPIYLLQTDEQNINFFVIEVNDSFSMSEMQAIFNAMGEQSSFLDEFWLPNFHKFQEYKDELGLPCTEVISTNYKNSLGSLMRKSKTRTKIIKAPFVFGMINKSLLEMLEIPFYCTLVRKEDLL